MPDSYFFSSGKLQMYGVLAGVGSCQKLLFGFFRHVNEVSYDTAIFEYLDRGLLVPFIGLARSKLTIHI